MFRWVTITVTGGDGCENEENQAQCSVEQHIIASLACKKDEEPLIEATAGKRRKR